MKYLLIAITTIFIAAMMFSVSISQQESAAKKYYMKSVSAKVVENGFTSKWESASPGIVYVRNQQEFNQVKSKLFQENNVPKFTGKMCFIFSGKSTGYIKKLKQQQTFCQTPMVGKNLIYYVHAGWERVKTKGDTSCWASIDLYTDGKAKEIFILIPEKDQQGIVQTNPHSIGNLSPFNAFWEIRENEMALMKKANDLRKQEVLMIEKAKSLRAMELKLIADKLDTIDRRVKSVSNREKEVSERETALKRWTSEAQRIINQYHDLEKSNQPFPSVKISEGKAKK